MGSGWGLGLLLKEIFRGKIAKIFVDQNCKIKMLHFTDVDDAMPLALRRSFFVGNV